MVDDNIAPVLTVPADIAGCDSVVTYDIPTATDNCTANIIQIAGLASGTTYPAGVTVNTFVATDVSGNSDTASFSVTVNPLPVASFGYNLAGLACSFHNTSTGGTAYLWDFGDGQTSSAQNPTHTYQAAGIYPVVLTVINECGSVMNGPVLVSVVNVGIAESTIPVNVSLFPNPTDGLFTLAIEGLDNQTLLISVMDVTGKLMFTKQVMADTNLTTLDATPFASGIYLVKVDGGNMLRMLRLVKK